MRITGKGTVEGVVKITVRGTVRRIRLHLRVWREIQLRGSAVTQGEQ